MGNKFREYLENEIEELTNGDDVHRWIGMGFSSVLEKNDELHKTAVIPHYVADWIEKRVFDKYDILNILASLPEDVFIWVYEDGNNIRVLLDAIVNGYEIEQEPKYLVQVPHENNRYYYYYSINNEIDSTIFIDKEYLLKDKEFHFTEEMIQQYLPDVPEKYWEEIE